MAANYLTAKHGGREGGGGGRGGVTYIQQHACTHSQLSVCDAGYKERVSRPEVTEAARFAKYAIAAYGAAGYQYLHQTS